MFDIGFFEICLIAIIALLVIGPEKLPRVARTTGLWLGKFRGMIKTVQYEIDEQVRIDELKRSLEKSTQPISQQLNETVSKIEKSLDKTQSEISTSSPLDPAASHEKSS